MPQGKNIPPSLDVQIRTRALECLVRIVSLYYKVSSRKSICMLVVLLSRASVYKIITYFCTSNLGEYFQSGSTLMINRLKFPLFNPFYIFNKIQDDQIMLYFKIYFLENLYI